MSGTCSICLSGFKEPVSIPCGHVYCTKCLADHVNTPGRDDTTSFCPTCRTVFSIVTPDLTYLPKKYHQYIVPGVRRVYLDTSGEASLKKKLTRAESRIRKLELEQETLLRQCEQHMSAARAHADGEMKERQRANKFERDLDAISSQSFADTTVSETLIKVLQDDQEQLIAKYQKLKKLYRDREQEWSHADIFPPRMSQYESPVNSSQNRNDNLSDVGGRKILPLPRNLPRKRAGPMSPSAPAAIYVEPAKRPRLSAPSQLQARGEARR